MIYDIIMSESKRFKTLQCQSLENIESKLAMYKENIKILEFNNKKITNENFELRNKVKTITQEKDEIISILHKKIKEKENTILNLRSKIAELDTIVKDSKNSSHFLKKTEEKSELMQTIESFKEQIFVHNSIKSTFDNTEENPLKFENQGFKNFLHKLEDLYPSLQKISNLSQKLFWLVQSFIAEDFSLSNLITSSPERLQKGENIAINYSQDIKKTREILEKTVDILSDYFAEKHGSTECKTI